MTISQLSPGLIADVIILLAMLLTGVYMVRVGRRLKTLRNGSSEMKALLEDFARHVDRSQQALADLRAVADGAGANLRSDIEAAERMHQDLIFALKACEGISARLEALRNDGRERVAALSEAVDRPVPAAAEAPSPARTQSTARRAPQQRPAPAPAAASPRTAARTVSAPVAQAAGPVAQAAAPAPRPQAASFDPAPVQAEALTAPVQPAQWRQLSPELAAAAAAPGRPEPESGDEPQRGAALKQFLMSMRNKEAG